MRKTKASSLVISLICVFFTVIISNCTKENGKIEVEPDIDDEPDIEVKSVLDIAPPGQYVQGSEQRLNELNSFKAEDKLVATYYFYWYNVDTKAHIVNNDGTDALQDHPYIMEGFSYENVDWHKQELLDMIDAGIDIVLPVYWGDSRNYNSWSIIGLKRLVDACNALNSEGINPPKIGMFYDTSSLMTEGVLKEANIKPDLTSDFGKEFFYKLIRDFFSLIPPDLRARVNGKPVVWLYSSSFAEKHDQVTFNFADDRFSTDFGAKDLYIVKEKSWVDAFSENVYAWGAALNGINALGIIAIGPGYNDSAVPGRTTPIREREEGQFYIDSWNQALVQSALTDKNIVVIETWNEYHEGTDIAHSREYGRQYINITSEYASYFKKGKMPENFPGKEFLGANEVSVTFEQNGDNNGINYIEHADGKNTVVMIEGVPCLKPVKTQYDGLYMYFQINSFFKLNSDEPIYIIVVEYYDSMNTGFAIDYDSKDEGAYKRLKRVSTTATDTWKEASFKINDAKFAASQNGGADFRIHAFDTSLCVKRVSVEIISN